MVLFLLVATTSCTGATQSNDEPPGRDPVARKHEHDKGKHLLVVVRTTRTPAPRVEIVSAREVDLPLPRERAPKTRADSWRVELLDGAGAVLSTAEVAHPDSVRGEFAAADGSMESHHVDREISEMIVRFPIDATARTLRVLVPEAAMRAHREFGRVALPQGAVQ